MALVYSYVRFSTKEQMLGHSLRRQVTDGDGWIAHNGHSPAAMTLRDLGVSAFRGKNRHTGALSRFLDAIKTGRVQPGSILLVENLDRLSRDVMNAAQRVFEEILDAGVLIAVLMPYERLYTKETLNDPFALMEPLMAFYLAHLESAKKAKRLRELWDDKRRNAAEKGTKFDVRCPSWVTWDEEAEAFVLNDGVDGQNVAINWEALAQFRGPRGVRQDGPRTDSGGSAGVVGNLTVEPPSCCRWKLNRRSVKTACRTRRVLLRPRPPEPPP